MPMRVVPIAIVAVLLGVAAASNATAQSSPTPDKSNDTLFAPTPDSALRDLDTDRPNKTDTPHTVDAGHVQIETGLLDFEHDPALLGDGVPETESWSLASTDVRVGITDRLELNAVITPVVLQTTQTPHGPDHTSGFGDLILGGKLNFWGDDDADGDWATALAIKPQVKLPTAPGSIGNGHAEYFVEFPFQMNLPADIHLGLQTVFSDERNPADTGYVGGWQNSVSIDRTLIAKLDVYAEYWMEVMSGHGGRTMQTVDVGATYPVTKSVQLDTGVNIGLNDRTPELEWLLGVSTRF